MKHRCNICDLACNRTPRQTGKEIGQKIAASLKESQANGERIGRRVAIKDPTKALELRSKGKTLRQIAFELRVSTYAVRTALKTGSEPGKE